MKHEQITRKIIAASMRVHSAIGRGFQEVIYQRALAIELNAENLLFSREKDIPVYYDDKQVGTRRADFIIEKTIILEIKAIDKLEDIQLAQALNYLRAYRLEVGLLINFGAKSLVFKRIHNNILINR